MPGATITISIHDEELRTFLKQLGERLGDLTPLMRNIGEILKERAMQSFASGESPEGRTWKPSRRARLQRGKTLIDTAVLRNSIHVQPGPRSVKVGTPIQYAGTHQFGAKKGSFGTVTAHIRAHQRKSRKGTRYSVRRHTRRVALPWGDIPPRPFLGVASEDWNDIHDAIARYAMKGR
jgi:phage virion morphogenesis protein